MMSKIILHPKVYDQLKGTGFDKNPLICRGKNSVSRESDREKKEEAFNKKEKK